MMVLFQTETLGTEFLDCPGPLFQLPQPSQSPGCPGGVGETTESIWDGRGLIRDAISPGSCPSAPTDSCPRLAVRLLAGTHTRSGRCRLPHAAAAAVVSMLEPKLHEHFTTSPPADGS